MYLYNNISVFMHNTNNIVEKQPQIIMLPPIFYISLALAILCVIQAEYIVPKKF